MVVLLILKHLHLHHDARLCVVKVAIQALRRDLSMAARRGKAARLCVARERAGVLVDVVVRAGGARGVCAALVLGLVPGDEEGAAAGDAGAADGDVDLDGAPEPRHVAVPRGVVGRGEEEEAVVEADGGGDEDEEADGEERDDLELLGGADLEFEEGAQRDDEDDGLEDEVEDRVGGHVLIFVDAGPLGHWDDHVPVVAERPRRSRGIRARTDGVRKGGNLPAL